MKKALVKIILMIIILVSVFNFNIYAVSLNIDRINDNAVNISLQTDKRNSKSSGS